MDIIRQALGCIKGGCVLDVATGEGEFVETLSSYLECYDRITGIDIHPFTRTGDSIFFSARACFVQMDAGWLGFADNHFDTVSISSSLHHLDNIPQFAKEMRRVLKPAGHLIIRETHQDIQTDPQQTDMGIHHWVADLDSALSFTHNKTFSRQALLAFAEILGLCNLAIYDIPNTDLDPFDEAAIKESEAVIDRYLHYAEGLPGEMDFRRRGEELRQQLHHHGVQWEPELIMIGEKGVERHS